MQMLLVLGAMISVLLVGGSWLTRTIIIEFKIGFPESVLVVPLVYGSMIFCFILILKRMKKQQPKP